MSPARPRRERAGRDNAHLALAPAPTWWSRASCDATLGAHAPASPLQPGAPPHACVDVSSSLLHEAEELSGLPESCRCVGGGARGCPSELSAGPRVDRHAAANREGMLAGGSAPPSRGPTVTRPVRESCTPAPELLGGLFGRSRSGRQRDKDQSLLLGDEMREGEKSGLGTHSCPSVPLRWHPISPLSPVEPG